ncbi:hypothetical protein EQV77_03670 [Halobacillus fulvus]|nr:hypothetical protein EQV77_03670 [Halobacillus fulvus]
MEKWLNQSRDQKITLEMIYLTNEGTATQRIIRVMKVKESHIIAYCFLKKEVRTFKKENILSIYPSYLQKKRKQA